MQKKWIGLIVLIFILQVILVAFMSYTALYYSTSIIGDTTIIITSLEKANYNDQLIQAGKPFIENPESVLGAYERIVSNLTKLVLFVMGAYITLGSLLWAFTHKLFNKEKLLALWLEMAKRETVFLLLILLIGYLSVSYLLSYYIYMLIVLDIILYFMLVCLTLPYQSLINTVKQTVKQGISKFYILVPAIIGSFAIISATGYLLYLSVEWSFAAMFLIILLFISSMAGTRILLLWISRTYAIKSA